MKRDAKHISFSILLLFTIVSIHAHEEQIGSKKDSLKPYSYRSTLQKVVASAGALSVASLLIYRYALTPEPLALLPSPPPSDDIPLPSTDTSLVPQAPSQELPVPSKAAAPEEHEYPEQYIDNTLENDPLFKALYAAAENTYGCPIPDRRIVCEEETEVVTHNSGAKQTVPTGKVIKKEVYAREEVRRFIKDLMQKNTIPAYAYDNPTLSLITRSEDFSALCRANSIKISRSKVRGKQLPCRLASWISGFKKHKIPESEHSCEQPILDLTLNVLDGTVPEETLSAALERHMNADIPLIYILQAELEVDEKKSSELYKHAIDLIMQHNNLHLIPDTVKDNQQEVALCIHLKSLIDQYNNRLHRTENEITIISKLLELTKNKEHKQLERKLHSLRRLRCKLAIEHEALCIYIQKTY